MAKYIPSDGLKAEIAKDYEAGSSMYKWCINRISNEMQLDNGGYVEFNKPTIETSFCFGYSDSRYDTEDYDRANNMAEVARSDEEYFKEQNLKELKSILGGLNEHRVLFYKSRSNDEVEIYNWCYDTYSTRERYAYLELIECSDRELQLLKEKYEEELVKFEKRINTYLKKYGLSKVHSWSYWRDE